MTTRIHSRALEAREPVRGNRQRTAVMHAPVTPISAVWQTALDIYVLAAMARNLSPGTIANRRSAITGLARWLEAEHGVTAPELVKKHHMQLAMSRAYKEREVSG